MKYRCLCAVLFPLLILTSCFGISADITLNRNGSGVISLEYQISKYLDALGRQDGNERWNTIPVGRSDFERTLERLPEMKLLSFSSREDERNLIISVRLEFSSIQGLLAFLDAQELRSSFTGDASSGRLVFTLNEGAGDINPALDSLLAGISTAYSVNISMTFPGEGSLSFTDKHGNPVHSGEIVRQGRKVSGIFPLYDVLSSGSGLNAEFNW